MIPPILHSYFTRLWNRETPRMGVGGPTFLLLGHITQHSVIQKQGWNGASNVYDKVVLMQGKKDGGAREVVLYVFGNLAERQNSFPITGPCSHPIILSGFINTHRPRGDGIYLSVTELWYLKDDQRLPAGILDSGLLCTEEQLKRLEGVRNLDMFCGLMEQDLSGESPNDPG